MKVAVCCARRHKLYRHGRSKTSQQKDKKIIWSLPEELLLHLLKGLHVKDLLNMRSTHPTFRNLIDNYPVVWTTACFKDAWPTLPNIKHLNNAANHGNVEALIKLGIAYLYNEGLPSDFQGKKVTTNGERAAEMFCKVETLLPNVTPFTWLFIRPPWATSGACCKECVFRNMKSYTAKYHVPNVTVCIAKTLQLLEEESLQREAVTHLEEATAAGSPHAAFLLWQQRHTKDALDPAAELEAIRELRNLVNLGDPDAILQLCRFYAQRKNGGISESQAACYVRNFIQSSKPNHIEEIYRQSELTHSMRYILVDWLVEVAGMKDFGSPTLHAAISVVDRFLRIHRTSRARFQLLGVAAMVLCSRFLGKDIITIREAAWLTDNTYKYEDVVRMMGEIIATLRGNIRVFCSLDYAQLIGQLANNEAPTQCLAEYVCELALLQSDLGPYPQAEVAASAVLLARLSQKQEFPWPQQMLQFTGYSVSDLAKCTMAILEKCFLEGAMVDHRAVVLQAVKQRYSDTQFYEVSIMKMPTLEDLQTLLGLHQAVVTPVDLRLELNNMPHLIMSPSRNKNGHAKRPCQMSVEREQAATPTLDSMEKSLDALFNESVLSGYDGDLEDELESALEEESEADYSLCQEDTSFEDISSHNRTCGSDSSGWFGSDTSISSFSPSPTNRPPISASTPTIRINLPSFGYITSSPISGYVAAPLLAQGPTTPRSHTTSAAATKSSPSQSGGMKCLLGGGNMSSSNLNISSLWVSQSSSVFTDTASLRRTRSNPLSFTLHKDSFHMAEAGIDSGIDITGLFDHSNSVSVLDTAKAVPSVRVPLGTISSANHNTEPTAETLSPEAKNGIKQRKRRNSSQLSNENKTHVISL